MKKRISIIVMFFASLCANAQQEAMYTHYAFNTLAINPAYAGSREALTITALHRSQWVGFKGAPMSQTLTLHSPIGEDMGVGLSFLHDRIGPVVSTAVFADYAYKVPIGTGSLAMGVKAGVDIFNIALSGLTAFDVGDVIAQNYSKVLPNVGVGFHYSHNKYFVGLSSPRLLPLRFYEEQVQGYKANEAIHAYLMGGYMFDINPKFQIKPIAFIRATPMAPIQGEITSIFTFDKRFELGAMYRTGDAFGILAGFNFENNLRIGYSFDWSYALSTGRYNSGSHEIVLRYDFVQAVNKKIVSPRNF